MVPEDVGESEADAETGTWVGGKDRGSERWWKLSYCEGKLVRWACGEWYKFRSGEPSYDETDGGPAGARREPAEEVGGRRIEGLS